jgi:glycosyltransferase involved in cell wall biosynthesis
MGCPRHKLRALPSGVAMAEIARRERNVVTAAPVFISVARLDRHKGIQLGIEAFARAAAALPGARYLVLGDGPERAALARRAAELGVADRVELRGQVTHDRVIAALQTANVHLFTSVRAADGRTEGVPNILKEAHACGVPAVAFAHQGVDEVVADGETGFIVPEGEVAAMAASAVELARAPARLAAMGRAADVRVRERFDLERVTDQLESIYARAIACVE